MRHDRSNRLGLGPMASRPTLGVCVVCLLAGAIGQGPGYADEDHQQASDKVNAKLVESGLPDLPEPLTSFGGAIVGDSIYLYGGHTGSAHSYSIEEQSQRFYRLHLRSPEGWEELPSSERLQGLALVGHEGSVYRLGGFTAFNAEGDDQDLRSQASFAKFDIASGKWSDLPPMPEPRSSFDAAVSGNTLLLVGGWSMQPNAESEWHDTAWTFDLADAAGGWKPAPKPPIQRRAFSMAAHDNKFFVIGGMQPNNKMTTRVDIYDPATRTWTRGPALEGEPTSGFGSAAFATGGRLYVSTIQGDLQRLSAEGDRWEVLGRFEPARFFHRMLPRDDNSLLLIGGANMSIGKFTDVAQLDVTER